MTLGLSCHEIRVKSNGYGSAVDVTPMLRRCAEGIERGLMNAYVSEEDAALVTIEYERGLLEDLKKFVEEYMKAFRGLAPTILGRSLDLPIVNGNIRLGTWQQVVFIDLGHRAREVSIYVTIIYED
ncbi:MAG: YjbQ family protein [Thermoprotei archaeon]|nr:YjbQ family protein [Thermoprotei archaeon]